MTTKLAACTARTALAKETFILNFDGASKGNPGRSSWGIFISHARLGRIYGEGRRLPDGTNNVAEYRALIEGLKACERLGIRRVLARGDSSLVVNQMKGEWKVKSESLAQWRSVAAKAACALSSVRYEYVPREQNSDADRLANVALRLTEKESENEAARETEEAKETLKREFLDHDPAPEPAPTKARKRERENDEELSKRARRK